MEASGSKGLSEAGLLWWKVASTRGGDEGQRILHAPLLPQVSSSYHSPSPLVAGSEAPSSLQNPEEPPLETAHKQLCSSEGGAGRSQTHWPQTRGLLEIRCLFLDTFFCFVFCCFSFRLFACLLWSPSSGSCCQLWCHFAVLPAGSTSSYPFAVLIRCKLASPRNMLV